MATGINGAKIFTSYFIEITSEFWNELKGTLTEKSASLKSAGHPERRGRWQQEFLQSLRGILSFISASPALSYAYECFHFHCSARPCSHCSCFNKELNACTVHEPVLTLPCLFVYFLTAKHFFIHTERFKIHLFIWKSEISEPHCMHLIFEFMLTCVSVLGQILQKCILLKTNRWKNRWFNNKFQGELHARACQTEY
jgi:hypothetical protein